MGSPVLVWRTCIWWFCFLYVRLFTGELVVHAASVEFTLMSGEPVGTDSVQAITLCDWNRDGLNDLVVTDANSLSWYVRTTNEQTVELAGVTLGSSPGARAVVCRDLDLDGRPDLVLMSVDSVVAFRNDGETVASTGTVLADCAACFDHTALAVSDVNNDGWPDVGFLSISSGDHVTSSALIVNRGGFTFEPQVTRCSSVYTSLRVSGCPVTTLTLGHAPGANCFPRWCWINSSSNAVACCA